MSRDGPLTVRTASIASPPMQYPTPRRPASYVNRLEHCAASLSISSGVGRWDLGDHQKRKRRRKWVHCETRILAIIPESPHASIPRNATTINSRNETDLDSATMTPSTLKSDSEDWVNVSKTQSLKGSLSSPAKEVNNTMEKDTQEVDNAASQNTEALDLLEGRAQDDAHEHADKSQEIDAFHDFDGVHYDPSRDETPAQSGEHRNVRRRTVRSSSTIWSEGTVPTPLKRMSSANQLGQGTPQRASGMVYYPAPVPRMLNLPKRLSQLPSAHVQAARKSQLFGQPQSDARQSVAWMSEAPENPSESQPEQPSHRRSTSSSALPMFMLNERMATNPANVPPQLRASVFFDHPAVRHDVAIQHGSAVATLDSILNASVRAPVSSFVDHPYAGDVRRTVYAPAVSEHQGSTSFPTEAIAQAKAKRRSSIGALFKRKSTDELVMALRKKGSRMSLMTDLDAGEAAYKLPSRMSMLALNGKREEPEEEEIAVDGEAVDQDDNFETIVVAQSDMPIESHSPVVSPRPLSPDILQPDLDPQDLDAQYEIDFDADPTYAQPTTLLAELQVRKAQMKSRSRTAAMDFPNGMHSTLLQLDAVEEVANRKRKQGRVPLAWEDSQAANQDNGDDEVPLGMLYPGKDGANRREWDRPIGLLEQRALEDNEPLSRRRNRLKGVSSVHIESHSVRPSTAPTPDADVARSRNEHAAAQGVEDDGDETLAQRMRRVKAKEALDSAVAEAVSNNNGKRKSGFTDEVMSQFGGLDIQDEPDAPVAQESVQPSVQPQEAEEETLGQRRARLQRERELNGTPRQSPLVTQTSFANLLANNPIGQRAASKLYQPPAGTLLYANAAQQAKQKSDLFNQNLRSSTMGLERPLTEPQHGLAWEQKASFGGLLAQQHSNRAPSGGFAGGMYNNGAGGAQFPGMSNPAMAKDYLPPGVYAPASQIPQWPQHAATHNPFAYQNMAAQQFQQYPQFPHQQPGMMGYEQAQGYGYPYMQAAGVQGMNTYAAAAQLGVGVGVAGLDMPLPDPPLDSNQRAAIDQWRMSIRP